MPERIPDTEKNRDDCAQRAAYEAGYGIRQREHGEYHQRKRDGEYYQTDHQQNFDLFLGLHGATLLKFGERVLPDRLYHASIHAQRNEKLCTLISIF